MFSKFLCHSGSNIFSILSIFYIYFLFFGITADWTKNFILKLIFILSNKLLLNFYVRCFLPEIIKDM